MIVLLASDLTIYRAIGAPYHGKYVIDVINTGDKKYLKEQINRLLKIIPTTCEGLGMLHSSSNKSAVDIAQKCKDILTETSHIVVKACH